MPVVDESPAARRGVLLVEDEALICMLLEDMLGDLGYEIAATASGVAEAAALARSGDFAAAILDVNLNGEEVFPVADILAERGIPFVFATGYGDQAMPPAHRDRPTLQKPFRQDALDQQLGDLIRRQDASR